MCIGIEGDGRRRTYVSPVEDRVLPAIPAVPREP